MASKTTLNLDDEMEAALAELTAVDGTMKLAIKRSLLAEVKRRRRSQAVLDLIASWEAEDGPIDREHLDWADSVLDRQGVDR
jgi:predicted transcriptional regulator